MFKLNTFDIIDTVDRLEQERSKTHIEREKKRNAVLKIESSKVFKLTSIVFNSVQIEQL